MLCTNSLHHEPPCSHVPVQDPAHLMPPSLCTHFFLHSSHPIPLCPLPPSHHSPFPLITLIDLYDLPHSVRNAALGGGQFSATWKPIECTPQCCSSRLDQPCFAVNVHLDILSLFFCFLFYLEGLFSIYCDVSKHNSAKVSSRNHMGRAKLNCGLHP